MSALGILTRLAYVLVDQNRNATAGPNACSLVHQEAPFTMPCSRVLDKAVVSMLAITIGRDISTTLQETTCKQARVCLVTKPFPLHAKQG